jgi:hypothetical protein
VCSVVSRLSLRLGTLGVGAPPCRDRPQPEPRSMSQMRDGKVISVRARELNEWIITGCDHCSSSQVGGGAPLVSTAAAHLLFRFD